jgi:1,4-dihydroxy-2-naphthoate octaprenyltransferase
LALTFYVIGIVIGFVLVGMRGLEILFFGVVGFTLGLLYTAPPLRLVHRGVGEIAIGIGFGPVIVNGAYWVQAQAWSWEAFWVALPVGLLIAAVLYINEFPDRLWDAKSGKRTLVVRLPINIAIVGYAALVGGAYLVIILGVMLNQFPLATLLGLLTFPMAWSALKKLRRYHAYPYRLIPANASTVFTHLLTGLLMFVGYVVSPLF